MKKITFNNIRTSENYLRNFEYLFSDYNLFREKHFSNLCIDQLQESYPESKLFLTHSATGALEMISHLLKIKDGDEIIMPSFTFVSTANAFASHGARPVFVDLDPTSLNIDVNLIEREITARTKAIVAVHYAGHPCDLERLSAICKKYHLYLIEDAAMAFGNQFEGKSLGSYGDFGVVSFDITKQISAVQGGLLLVNNSKFAARAENIYHIGTDRTQFMDGKKPYYEWVDVGSKFQMGELSAVVLNEHLFSQNEICAKRNLLSRHYFENLREMSEEGCFTLMNESSLTTNFHEFYLIVENESIRKSLKDYLLKNGIEAMFHYIPLHNSYYGKMKSRSGNMEQTESIAGRLLRLPLHTDLEVADIEFISDKVKMFFSGKR